MCVSYLLFTFRWSIIIDRCNGLEIVFLRNAVLTERLLKTVELNRFIDNDWEPSVKPSNKQIRDGKES